MLPAYDEAMNKPLSLFILLCCLSCVSEIKVSFLESKGTSSQAAITLGGLGFSAADFSQEVEFTIPYAGDSNDNASVVLYYCSIATTWMRPSFW